MQRSVEWWLISSCLQATLRSRKRPIWSTERWLPRAAAWTTLPPSSVCFSHVKPGKELNWLMLRDAFIFLFVCVKTCHVLVVICKLWAFLHPAATDPQPGVKTTGSTGGRWSQPLVWRLSCERFSSVCSRYSRLHVHITDWSLLSIHALLHIAVNITNAQFCLFIIKAVMDCACYSYLCCT